MYANLVTDNEIPIWAYRENDRKILTYWNLQLFSSLLSKKNNNKNTEMVTFGQIWC